MLITPSFKVLGREQGKEKSSYVLIGQTGTVNREHVRFSIGNSYLPSSTLQSGQTNLREMKLKQIAQSTFCFSTVSLCFSSLFIYLYTDFLQAYCFMAQHSILLGQMPRQQHKNAKSSP